jgi:hypothetical protein
VPYLATFQSTDITGKPIRLEEFFEDFPAVAKSVALELQPDGENRWFTFGANFSIIVEKWDK